MAAFVLPKADTTDPWIVVQRLTAMTTYSMVEQLQSARIDWQRSAATYRQWADPISRQYYASLKRRDFSRPQESFTNDPGDALTSSPPVPHSPKNGRLVHQVIRPD